MIKKKQENDKLEKNKNKQQPTVTKNEKTTNDLQKLWENKYIRTNKQINNNNHKITKTTCKTKK